MSEEDKKLIEIYKEKKKKRLETEGVDELNGLGERRHCCETFAKKTPKAY